MLLPVFAATFLTLAIALLLAFTTRIRAILPPNRAPRARTRFENPSASAKFTRRNRRLERAGRDGIHGLDQCPYGHVMVVLGSGGHTAEMLLMLEGAAMGLWRRRTWVASSGDGFSLGLAEEFESRLGLQKHENASGKEDGARKNQGASARDYEVFTLPRARRVHQSLLTTPWTSLICLWAAIHLLKSGAPDVILTNGPGTGVIVVLASLILRFFDLQGAGSGKTRIVYVESLARCKTLSLSGRLLRGVVDRFMVQWPDLEGEYRNMFALDAAVQVGMTGVGDTDHGELMRGKVLEFVV